MSHLLILIAAVAVAWPAYAYDPSKPVNKSGTIAVPAGAGKYNFQYKPYESVKFSGTAVGAAGGAAARNGSWTAGVGGSATGLVSKGSDYRLKQTSYDAPTGQFKRTSDYCLGGTCGKNSLTVDRASQTGQFCNSQGCRNF